MHQSTVGQYVIYEPVKSHQSLVLLFSFRVTMAQRHCLVSNGDCRWPVPLHEGPAEPGHVSPASQRGPFVAERTNANIAASINPCHALPPRACLFCLHFFRACHRDLGSVSTGGTHSRVGPVTTYRRDQCLLAVTDRFANEVQQGCLVGPFVGPVPEDLLPLVHVSSSPNLTPRVPNDRGLVSTRG